MKTLVIAMVAYLSSLFRSRRSLHFEIVALRHQLTVYQRTVKRPRRSRRSCAGEGATILPYSNVSEEIEMGLVSARKLVEPPIRRQVCMAIRNHATSKLVRDTASVVRQVTDEHREEIGWMRAARAAPEFTG